MSQWFKDSLIKIWEGILKHLGVIIAAFIFSGGYLVAINKLKELQEWVRSIPTDYVLTPFVLLFVTLLVIIRINQQQRHQLSKLETQKLNNDEKYNFVTHYGVWWKIYPDSEYIEDFPYCPCCDPKKKLVQIEWYPNEIYKCPKTNTEIKLYDKIPWEKGTVLENLYKTYFGGSRLDEIMFREFNRIKRLYPDKEEIWIVKEVFGMEPFNRIPEDKLNEIFDRFDSYHEIFHFLSTNYMSYRKYLKDKKA